MMSREQNDHFVSRIVLLHVPLIVQLHLHVCFSPFDLFFVCLRLTTGALQLARGTHLTIDETGLLPGPLNAVGVNNAKLLKDLLELQTVAFFAFPHIVPFCNLQSWFLLCLQFPPMKTCQSQLVRFFVA